MQCNTKAVARGGATSACAPPFSKKRGKIESTFSKKKYNMNKQNFDLTFLEKFIY